MDFEKETGLITAVIQDAESLQVLMVGFMNEEALAKTEIERRVTFFSRSKQRLWTKGETSGNFLQVVSITEDCDEDALLIKVIPQGPVCHLGTFTCFSEEREPQSSFLVELEKIIRVRKEEPSDNSYTSALFKQGVKAIAQKVGEEGLEVALEGVLTDDSRLNEESADLIFHLLILLIARGSSLSDVIAVLDRRNRQHK